MKKIFLFAILFAVMSFNCFAQDQTHDPNAKKILDEVSTMYQQYTSLRAAFDFTMENKTENIKESKSGYMFVKKSKYKMILPGMEMFTDGSAMYTYQKDVNEITINNVNDQENSIMNPSKMFDIYKSGFKYKLEGEKKLSVKEKVDGKVVTSQKDCYVINLYPEKPQGVKYHTVKIVIIKASKQLYSITYMQKDGTNYCIEINEYKPNANVTDAMFSYSESKYPDADVNDMR